MVIAVPPPRRGRPCRKKRAQTGYFLVRKVLTPGAESHLYLSPVHVAVFVVVKEVENFFQMFQLSVCEIHFLDISESSHIR